MKREYLEMLYKVISMILLLAAIVNALEDIFYLIPYSVKAIMFFIIGLELIFLSNLYLYKYKEKRRI